MAALAWKFAGNIKLVGFTFMTFARIERQLVQRFAYETFCGVWRGHSICA
jgi:hypothetical protein